MGTHTISIVAGLWLMHCAVRLFSSLSNLSPQSFPLQAIFLSKSFASKSVSSITFPSNCHLLNSRLPPWLFDDQDLHRMFAPSLLLLLAFMNILPLPLLLSTAANTSGRCLCCCSPLLLSSDPPTDKCLLPPTDRTTQGFRCRFESKVRLGSIVIDWTLDKAT